MTIITKEDYGLEALGIKQYQEISRNASFEELFQLETDPHLTGYDKGVVTKTGAVAVDTGKFTGRSPKDKYVVEEEALKKDIW